MKNKRKKLFPPNLIPNRAPNWKNDVVLIKLRTHHFQFNLRSQTRLTHSLSLLLSFWQTTESHPQTTITHGHANSRHRRRTSPQTTDHRHHVIEVSVAITDSHATTGTHKANTSNSQHSPPHPLTKRHTSAPLGQVVTAEIFFAGNVLVLELVLELLLLEFFLLEMYWCWNWCWSCCCWNFFCWKC